jgi:G3E family GTPase
VIPFVILTGFLGSGKTTLLNRLLADRQAANITSKIGLIVNELGAVGVDGELLPQGASRQIELPGGCVCCVLSDDLATTVVELIEATPDLEAIVLETTGVAEPLPLAWALERPPLDERVRLAAVISLVDALGFLSSRSLSPAVDAQVAYADVLLLTKGSLAAASSRLAIAAAVHELAPRAELREGGTAEHAAWLAALLTDPPLAALPATERERGAHDAGAATAHEDHDHQHDDHDAAHGHRHAPHDSAGHAPAATHLLDSVSTLLPDVIVDLEELEDRLADLPASYVRIKGIIRAVDGRRANAEVAWYAFHRVGLRVSSEPLGHHNPTSARVVALGREVEIDSVKACIESALVSR